MVRVDSKGADNAFRDVSVTSALFACALDELIDDDGKCSGENVSENEKNKAKEMMEPQHAACLQPRLARPA